MIYSIHPQVDNYLWFNIDGDAARKALGEDTMFHFDESPVSYRANWSPMEIEFYSSNGKKGLPNPDVSQRHGRLLLSEKAHAALHPLMEQSGEFLPVYCDDYQGYLFNILAVEDSALNPKLCQKNEWGEISWLAFDETKVESTVFRTEYDNFMSVFCTEALLNAYKAANLTGLVFTENLAPEPV